MIDASQSPKPAQQQLTKFRLEKPSGLKPSAFVLIPDCSQGIFVANRCAPATRDFSAIWLLLAAPRCLPELGQCPPTVTDRSHRVFSAPSEIRP